MPRGLLSRIATGERDGDEVTAVIEHLRELLNASRGGSVSSPEYGLPDFNDLIHELPYAMDEVQQMIRNCVMAHEPRLGSVRVRHVPGGDPLRLTFEIVARLKSDRQLIRVRTEVSPGGHFSMGS